MSKCSPEPEHLDASDSFKTLSCRCFPGRKIWVNAFRVQSLVVRNAIASVSCACVTNGCFALGNVFSGKSSTHQSSSELIIANATWFAIWYIILLLVSHVPALRSLHFTTNPDQRPTLVYCISKLVCGSYRYAVLTVALMVTTAFLCVDYGPLPKYKLDVYLAILCSSVYNAGIGLTFRNIFFLETQEGRERLLKRQLPRATNGVKPHSIVPLEQTPKYRPPSFWPLYCKLMWELVGLLTICGFLHVVSRQNLSDSGGMTATWFVIGSAFFKFTIQLTLRHYVFKMRVRDMRMMSIIVGLPTALIDTQTRIILLGLNNTQDVITSTIGMALLEIALRFVKALWLMRDIRRREKAVRFTNSPRLVRIQQNSSISQPNNVEFHRDLVLVQEFELWRQKCHAYHTAELHADMYAEYIAIGCSASVLFFLGTNAHYSRLGFSRAGPTLESFASNGEFTSLSFQIFVEVAVDYVCIVSEMATGVEYTKTQELSSFSAVIFMTIAFLNIMLTVMAYLD